MLNCFDKKYWNISDISIWNFNEMLTNNVVSFEQLGPEIQYLFFLPLRSV